MNRPEETLEEFRTMLYATLQKLCKRVSARVLCESFRKDHGYKWKLLDYARKFGFINVISFLNSIPDLVEVRMCPDGNPYKVALVKELRTPPMLRYRSSSVIHLNDSTNYPDFVPTASDRVNRTHPEQDDYYQLLLSSNFAIHVPKVLKKKKEERVLFGSE